MEPKKGDVVKVLRIHRDHNDEVDECRWLYGTLIDIDNVEPKYRVEFLEDLPTLKPAYGVTNDIWFNSDVVYQALTFTVKEEEVEC